jgi:hypothetical protein
MKTDDLSSDFPTFPPPTRRRGCRRSNGGGHRLLGSGLTHPKTAGQIRLAYAVRRMLDPNHDTRPEKIQASLEALGKRVVMEYDDAA